MVFVPGVCVGGVGVDVPVHFVREPEPDLPGEFVGERLHGCGYCGGGDGGEGYPWLEGDVVDGSGVGGGAGATGHLRVGHAGAG